MLGFAHRRRAARRRQQRFHSIDHLLRRDLVHRDALLIGGEFRHRRELAGLQNDRGREARTPVQWIGRTEQDDLRCLRRGRQMHRRGIDCGDEHASA